MLHSLGGPRCGCSTCTGSEEKMDGRPLDEAVTCTPLLSSPMGVCEWRQERSEQLGESVHAVAAAASLVAADCSWWCAMQPGGQGEELGVSNCAVSEEFSRYIIATRDVVRL